jgi:hypothetical protein
MIISLFNYLHSKLMILKSINLQKIIKLFIFCFKTKDVKLYRQQMVFNVIVIKECNQ